MLKLKTPLICAGAGCILSFFLGLINGVQFFSILVRSGITGIIFGGFVFVTVLILHKFLPELFSFDTLEDTSFSGSNVNITLDDGEYEGLSIAQGNYFMPENDASSGGDNFTSNFNDSSSGFDSLSTADSFDSTEVQDDMTGLMDFDSSTLSGIDDFEQDTISNTETRFSIDDNQAAVANTKVMAEAIRTILKTDE